jgi:hypothetical protein
MNSGAAGAVFAIVAIVAYFWPLQAENASHAFCKNIQGFEFEMCLLYNRCVRPLEISYKFQSFHSLGGRPPLSKAFFSPHKPLILLVGPYSTGKFEYMTCTQAVSAFSMRLLYLNFVTSYQVKPPLLST